MLARLNVKFEPGIFIANKVEFPVREYERDGYAVREFIPAHNLKETPQPDLPELTIDNQPASLCNFLRLEFQKPTFDRRDAQGVTDPPVALVRTALSSLMARLRCLLKAGQLRVPDYPLCTWHIKYTNDDGSDLPEEEGLYRERAAGMVPFGWVALSPKHWKEVVSLSPDFAPKPWDELLLDAGTLFPHIGPTVVLAATALEVFISTVLDDLARIQGVAKGLWEWINARNDRSSNPGLEEQYDALLKVLSGHSLKEDNELWEVFKNLKAARNSFVHEGVAKLNKKPITWNDASTLAQKAARIPLRVREWLPEELRWPIYDIRFDLTVSKRLI